MKTWILAGMVAFGALGCSGADELGVGTGDEGAGVDESVGSTEEALVGWTQRVSEEYPAQTCGGTANVAATAAWCAGRYCDDIYLHCGAMPAGFTTNGIDYGWTPYVSEELGSPVAQCPGGSVIDGIRARGRYADDVSVHCTGVNFPSRWLAWWQPQFSEEQGGQTFSGVPNQPNQLPSLANAVRCFGDYCDNLQFVAVSRGCTADAQCGAGRFCDWDGVCRFPNPG